MNAGTPEIDNFIPNRNIDLLDDQKYDHNISLLNNISLQESGSSQIYKVNFDNTITLYTDNINNDIKTFANA